MDYVYVAVIWRGSREEIVGAFTSEAFAREALEQIGHKFGDVVRCEVNAHGGRAVLEMPDAPTRPRPTPRLTDEEDLIQRLSGL